MSPSKAKKGNGVWIFIIGLIVVLAIAGMSGGARPLGSSGATSTATPSGTTGTQVTSAAVLSRLQALGLQARLTQSSVDTNCAAHSYGQVQSWFRTHPCTEVVRLLFAGTDARGNSVLVAVAGVRMPDANSAAALKALVDKGGTGNITELAGTWVDGMPYASRRSGAVFVNAQAQATGGRSTADLAAIAGAASGG